MSKRTLVISISSVIFILLALGYFVALPQVQGANYTSSIKSKQASLSVEAAKLKDLFDLDLFTKTDQTSDEVRVDVKNATDTINAVKTKLSASSSSLTDFTEYPLLAWNPVYKNALDLNKQEKAYVDNLEKAVTEFEAVIAYFDDTADVATRVEAGTAVLSSVETMTTMEEIITAFEKATKTMRGGLEDFEKLTPPESLKVYHTEFLSYNKQGLNLMDQFIAALKSNDMAKIEEYGNKIQKLEKTGDTKAADVQKDIVEHSVLRKYIDQAATNNTQITKIFGKS